MDALNTEGDVISRVGAGKQLEPVNNQQEIVLRVYNICLADVEGCVREVGR
jgi:hypothetical protein